MNAFLKIPLQVEDLSVLDEIARIVSAGEFC